MRGLVIGALALSALAVADARPAAAQEYPWCAHYGRFGGMGANCGFVSFAQCQATVSGIGGFCQRNPMVAYSREIRRPARKARPHRRY